MSANVRAGKRSFWREPEPATFVYYKFSHEIEILRKKTGRCASNYISGDRIGLFLDFPRTWCDARASEWLDQGGFATRARIFSTEM